MTNDNQSNDQELWQAYDEQGNQITGKGLTKPQAREGSLHGAAHLWLWRHRNNRLEVLLQKRAEDKPTWPGYYDISAAGHIDFSETPLEAILRETKEEIGFKINPVDIHLLFVYRQYLKDGGIIENEFQWVFGMEVKTEAEYTVDREVELVAWMSMDKFTDYINGDIKGSQIVPQGKAYFDNLLKEIGRLEEST